MTKSDKSNLATIPEFHYEDYASEEVGGFHERRKPLTTWIPSAYKERYEELQRRTNRMFGKHLQEVIQLAIDKVDK